LVKPHSCHSQVTLEPTFLAFKESGCFDVSFVA
jgi:hypothetical protein